MLKDNAKATDNQIIKAYEHVKSVWKVAEIFGMCGQSVHERLQRLGIKTSKRYTAEEIEFITTNYEIYVNIDGLDMLAKRLGRCKTSICRKAKELGLTDIKRKTKESTKKKLSNAIITNQKLNGHPRGMLGKTHTQNTKEIIGKKSKDKWNEMKDKMTHIEYRDAMAKRANNRKPQSNPYSRCWSGWFTHNDKKYFMRSKWEYNYALYLNFLVKQGNIKTWTYEPDTFWFMKIKRGVRSYTPDFKITNLDNSFEYHEVKGWMDKKSATKIKRMAKYYPDIVLRVIDFKRMKEVGKYKEFIDGWMEIKKI